MLERRGVGDFTQVYRPCKLSEVIGNEKAKKILKKAFQEKKVPHNFLFHGLSGSGKTTLARIIMMGVNCKNGPTSEPCCKCDSCVRIINQQTYLPVLEFNAVELTKEEIKYYLNNFEDGYYASFSGVKFQVMVVDESHGLTDQQAGVFLKPTEDVAPWNYFIFCTTDPEKMLKTLRNRCMKIPFEKVPDDQIMKLLSEICEKENLQHDKDVLQKIIDKSEGMPREAVIQLQAAVLTGDIRERKIKAIIGKNNILLIAPHGVKDDDDYTNIIAEELAENFGFYAVINDRYQKPSTIKVKPNPDKDLLDLNKIEDAEKVEDDKFLGSIDEYVNDIIKNYGEALIFLIHGIKDANILEAGQKIGPKKLGFEPSQLDTLIGYGQWEDPNDQHLTAERKTIDTLITKLKDNEINAAEAPTEPITVDGDDKWYCGWDEDRMNQYLYNSGLPFQSIQVEIKNSGFREDPDTARKTAGTFGKASSSLILRKRKTGKIMPVKPYKEIKADQSTQEPQVTDAELKTEPVQKKIKVAEIELKDKSDLKYIFRFRISAQEDPELKARLDAEIEGLANSIKHDGLAHPLVLIQKKDKKYMILCGYRRYQALRKLGVEEVEAAIYQEGDLTDEQAMRLSLAENTERRDLNDIEIGHFLKSSIENLGWTQERLGREFGESLGFGISHSAVNKRLKLYELWEKRESIDLMFAYLNGEVNFGLISEELTSIDDEKDRDALYESIVKPLKPTKAELHEIKNLLRENGGGYQSVLSRKEIKKVLNQAQSSNNHGSEELIKLLKIHKGDALTKQKIDFDQKADAIRKSLFGKDASGDDFSIIPPPDMEKDEFTVQFRLARDGLKDTMKKIKQFVNKEEFIDELFTIIDGNPDNV